MASTANDGDFVATSGFRVAPCEGPAFVLRQSMAYDTEDRVLRHELLRCACSAFFGLAARYFSLGNRGLQRFGQAVNDEGENSGMGGAVTSDHLSSGS